MPDAAHASHGEDVQDRREISVEALAQKLAGGDAAFVVIDVREQDEVALARVPAALHVPLARALSGLPLNLEKTSTIALMCASGARAARARDALSSQGYTDVRIVSGGMTAWLAGGHPATGSAVPSAHTMSRYDRQMRLPEVGAVGQAKLGRAKVAVVGAGGLGCPVLLYLAAAGVGHLTIVDGDTVALDNLHRQVLYGTADVGADKVHAAKASLLRGSPHVTIDARRERLTETNARDVLQGHDVLVDATDNYAARRALNDASCMLSIPSVFGAVSRFAGEVLTHVPKVSACYACLHPAPPGPGLARTCAEEGVLGVVPGIVGVLQANEVLKLLLGFGTPLTGRLLVFDAHATTFRTLALDRVPTCASCG